MSKEEQNRTVHQVPIDTVNPDELPKEHPIKYEEVCRIVGDLYIQMGQQRLAMGEQFQAVVGQLQSRLQEYMEEITRLKRELMQKHEGLTEGDHSGSHLDGQGEV